MKWLLLLPQSCRINLHTGQQTPVIFNQTKIVSFYPKKRPTWKGQSGRVQATKLVFVKRRWKCGWWKWWARWNSTRWLGGHKGKKWRKNGKNNHFHAVVEQIVNLIWDLKKPTTGIIQFKLNWFLCVCFACWFRRQLYFWFVFGFNVFRLLLPRWTGWSWWGIGKVRFSANFVSDPFCVCISWFSVIKIHFYAPILIVQLLRLLSPHGRKSGFICSHIGKYCAWWKMDWK